jgi:hypothetical protein
MKWIILVIFFTTVSFGQVPDGDSIVKSPTELLSQKSWTLSRMGYDENENNMLDPGENILTSCERDNLYLFSPCGIGAYFDSGLVCGNGLTETVFSWKWIREGRMLRIGEQVVDVTRLNETEFSFYIETVSADGRLIKLISSLHHE